MRDENELRAVGHRADDVVVPGHVRFIERSIDLVENAERRRLDLEDGKDEADRGQRLLAAAHQLDGRQLLARGLRDDVDARLQHVLGVGQPELGATAAEHAREDLFEALVHGLERLLEEPPRLAVHLLDRAREVAQSLLEVGLLRRVERKALFGLGVLAHRVEVHAAHALDETRQLLDARPEDVVGRRAHVVVADDPRQAQATEFLGHAAEQVLHRQLLLPQRHLVKRQLLAHGIHARAELLQCPFALEQPSTQLFECAAHAGQLRLRIAGGIERTLQELLVRHHLSGRLPEGRRVRHELLFETVCTVVQLLRTPGQALLRAPRRRQPLARASDAHLARRHRLALRIEPLASFAECRLGVAQLSLRELNARLRFGQGPRRFFALAGGLVDRALELGVFGGERLRPAQHPVELPFGLLKVLLGRHQRQLLGVGFVARSIERSPRLCELGARALQRLETGRHHRVEPLDLLGQLARLAFAVEHSGRDQVALPAGDAAVRVHDRPVERHDGRMHPFAAKPSRAGHVAHDDGIAHQRVDERLVFGREVQRIGQKVPRSRRLG